MHTDQYLAIRQAAQSIADRYSEDSLINFFQSPLIILSAPRAGSTLLFEALKKSDELWSIGIESHVIFSVFPELHPAQNNFESGRLTEVEATPEICHLMRACFLLLLQNHVGHRLLDIPAGDRPKQVQLLEKTPRNALNLPFLLCLFPDLKVVFLHREPRANISSIALAWERGLSSGQFVTFPNLPGWERRRWCLLLPPKWRSMNGKTLVEIATFQWCAANEAILEDLKMIKRDRWVGVTYDNLITNPVETINRIAKSLNIKIDGPLIKYLENPLPLSNTTVTAPSKDKWKVHRHEIEEGSMLYAPVKNRLDALENS